MSVAGQFVCDSEKYCVIECMCLLQGSLCLAAKSSVIECMCLLQGSLCVAA